MEAFTYRGLRIYPVRLNGQPRWAVQSLENVGTTRTFGDTLHSTVEDAKEFADYSIKESSSRTQKLEREKIEKADRDAKKSHNKGKSLSQIRTEQLLDLPISENGRTTTRRQWLEEKIKQGKQLRVTQENKLKPMSRIASNRATMEQQIEHANRVKKAGKKDVYWIGNYEISKTEYDYAVNLSNTLSSSVPDYRENARQLNEKVNHLVQVVSTKLQELSKSERMTWSRRNVATTSAIVMKALNNIIEGKLSPGSKIIYRLDDSIDVSTHLLEMEIGKNLCIDSFGYDYRDVLSEKGTNIQKAVKIIDSLIQYTNSSNPYELRGRIVYWLNRALYRRQVRCAVAKTAVMLKSAGVSCKILQGNTKSVIATDTGKLAFQYNSSGLRKVRGLSKRPFRTLANSGLYTPVLCANNIAKTIFQQLGANKFVVMTGAKMLVHGDNWLSFRIGRNTGSWNYVKISLTPTDLYDMEFATLSKLGDTKKKKVIKGLYADQLQTVFTDNTGMYTRL